MRALSLAETFKMDGAQKKLIEFRIPMAMAERYGQVGTRCRLITLHFWGLPHCPALTETAPFDREILTSIVAQT